MDHYQRSLRNALITPQLARLGLQRNDNLRMRQIARQPASCFVPVLDGLNLFSAGLMFEPLFLRGDDPFFADAHDADVVFLGEQQATCFFAIDLSTQSQLAETLAARGRFHDLQTVGVHLPQDVAGLLAYARAMSHWHRTHRHCGRCGAPTHAEQAGHVRVCSSCRAQHFPRTDPAVIVLVEREERCLLGRQVNWPEKLYSVIAGFVEPAESVEQSVVREVREETNIEVVDIHYASSQPWPFPSSLMLGFTARGVTETIVRNDDELADAEWFSRQQLVSLVKARDIELPNPLSIAHRLIEHWFDGAQTGAFANLTATQTP